MLKEKKCICSYLITFHAITKAGTFTFAYTALKNKKGKLYNKIVFLIVLFGVGQMRSQWF